MREISDQEFYEIARYVGIPGDDAARLLGVLKLLVAIYVKAK